MIPENSFENVYFIWLPCVELVEDLMFNLESVCFPMCPRFFYYTEESNIFYLADDKGIENDCILNSLRILVTPQIEDTYSTEIED